MYEPALKEYIIQLIAIVQLIAISGYIHMRDQGVTPLYGIRRWSLRALSGLIAVIAFIYTFNLTTHSPEEWVRTNIAPHEYEGYILSKFLDSKNRNEPTIILYDDYNITQYNMKIYDLMQPGDYIIKHAGTLKHYLVHDHDTILYYPLDRNGIPIKDSADMP